MDQHVLSYSLLIQEVDTPTPYYVGPSFQENKNVTLYILEVKEKRSTHLWC